MSSPASDAPRGLEAALRDRAAADARMAGQLDRPLRDAYDVVVIGSGPGGGTLAYALARAGRSVLLVERGDFLPAEAENWESRAVLGDQRYSNSEQWEDSGGSPYQAHMYYYVGGMTKLYAGTLLRFREQDFGELVHQGGTSPAWPVSYSEFEPYYAAAERLYLAHGEAGIDPTEPPRSGAFPHPPVPVVPEVADLAGRLAGVGLHPFPMPQGLALGDGGRCLFCAYCDSHPCRVLARAEPELCCIRPGLELPNFTLLRNARALRLATDSSGAEVVSVEVEYDGETVTIGGGLFAVCCGAVNTPALLLSSASDRHPDGLANSSGLVGACYMRHESTLLLAQDTTREQMPQDHFWKSIGFHDYYLDGDDGWDWPLGAVQVTGNYHEMMEGFVPRELADRPEERRRLAAQALPLFLLTEDLPASSNRVSLTAGGGIRVTYSANNSRSHQRLIDVMADRLQQAGYGHTMATSFPELTSGGGYHHCGTARFGDDAGTSVLDRDCFTHDVRNLCVVDSCFFPGATAINPVLTIAANALRVADAIGARG
jgi:choline dehydrogenase-like flavoprotein